MRLVVADDYEGLSRLAADRVVAELRADPGLLLCAAAGSTPARLYELLVERRRREPSVFERLRVLKLDEWGGLAMDDPATCEVDLRRRLIEPLGLSADRYIAFRSDAKPPREECERIRRALEAQGPVGLCVLGLGLNGHLGLNEPAPELQPGPHVARLSRRSLEHPMLRRARAAVRQGLTLGIADILRSRTILLLVSGSEKREPMERLLSGRISTSFPASFLWLHGDATCLCDREAATEPDPEAA